MKNRDFFSDMEDRLGKGSITLEKRELEVIPTGSLSLDVSTGIGGIPKGKITELFGPEGVGKTTLALEIARNAIENGEKVLYIDVENMIDYDYASHISRDEKFDSLIIVQPDTAEDSFMVAEAGINSEEFSLIIFDSIGGLAPLKEKEDDFGDANVALVPRLLSKFLRRTSYAIRTKNIAFLFLNQVRDKIGSYVQGYETPGGHALKHYSSLIIALSKGREIRAGDKKIGMFTKFVIKKNKLASPFRSHVIPFIFGEGVDRLKDFLTFAEMIGAVQKAGSYYKFEGENIGQGLLKSMEELDGNKELLDKIMKVVYTATSKYTKEIDDGEEVDDGEES